MKAEKLGIKIREAYSMMLIWNGGRLPRRINKKQLVEAMHRVILVIGHRKYIMTIGIHVN